MCSVANLNNQLIMCQLRIIRMQNKLDGCGDKKTSQQSGALTHIRLAAERKFSLAQLDYAAAPSVNLNSQNR